MEFVRLPRKDSDNPSPALAEEPAAPALEQPTQVWDVTKQPSLWSVKALKRLFTKK